MIKKDLEKQYPGITHLVRKLDITWQEAIEIYEREEEEQ